MPRAKPITETPADTPEQVQTKRRWQPLCDVNIKALSVTLREVRASKVVHTCANTVARVAISLVDDRLG